MNPTPPLPTGEGAIKVLPYGEDLGEVKNTKVAGVQNFKPLL